MTDCNPFMGVKQITSDPVVNAREGRLESRSLRDRLLLLEGEREVILVARKPQLVPIGIPSFRNLDATDAFIIQSRQAIGADCLVAHSHQKAIALLVQ